MEMGPSCVHNGDTKAFWKKSSISPPKVSPKKEYPPSGSNIPAPSKVKVMGKKYGKRSY